MSWTPQRVSIEDFALLLTHFPFNRHISTIHLHQSGYPDHRQYRGAESIAQLRRQHMQRYGLQNLAQHLTVSPDGTLWLGRDWDLPPASVAGHNGNSSDGPLMITLIGNFAMGEDELSGDQRESVLQLLTLIAQRFDLSPEAIRSAAELRGHSHLRLSWDAEEVRREVEQRRKETREAKEVKEDKPSRGGKESKEAKSSARNVLPVAPLSIGRVLETMRQPTTLQGDPLDAELPEEIEMSAMQPNGRWTINGNRPSAFMDGEQERWFGGARLAPEEIDRLRPHLINLNQGQFSGDGDVSTTKEDVDVIFEEHLERAFTAAQARGQKLKLVFYAHGGLVDEGSALQQAAQHIPWWKRNGIYPLYFIWETGFFETLGQLLSGRGGRGARERPSDVWVEWFARLAGGPRIWLGMKESAARASAPAQGSRPVGGARYAAQCLKKFCDTHAGQVELYAIGHSAGAIFHNEFVPVALELGVPAFEQVHLLAPAVTVDNFKDGMMPKMGKGIDHISIFTLRKDLELRDDSSPLYNKSILYLIHESLEPLPKTPILGLEIALRSDLELKKAFGLGSQVSKQGEVIWASTEVTSGRSATRARRHGEFGNDAVTLNSLVRRVLGVSDETDIEEFPEVAADRSVRWGEDVETVWGWPEPVTPFRSARSGRVSLAPQFNGSRSGVQGTRRALCVGIDEYQDSPLYGCVADATLWADTLTRLGFESHLLTNQQATFTGIQSALSDLLRSSQAGDVVVFQFAGHGTLLPDMGGDEAGGITPENDQAICPYDHDQGAYLIDDDLGNILQQTPDGVNVTCFIDCCFSGTISRFAVGSPNLLAARGGNQRARYLKPTVAMLEAHRRFRQGRRQRSLVGSRGPSNMREIVFSACQPNEVAWESNGQGDFTRQATRLLEMSGLQVSNEAFMEQVIAAFGPTPRQRPMLDSSDGYRTLPLLQPLVTSPVAGGVVAPVGGTLQDNGHGNGRIPPAVEDAVDQMAAAVQQLRSALYQL